MINQRYSNAIIEILHYLKGINKEDINRISKKFMKFLKNNENKNYECKFNYTKPLKDKIKFFWSNRNISYLKLYL